MNNIADIISCGLLFWALAWMALMVRVLHITKIEQVTSTAMIIVALASLAIGFQVVFP